MKPIIEVRNLSKKYRIGATQPRYLSLRDSLTSTFKGVKNWVNFDKSSPSQNEFWALQNIDFQLNAGESVGIIGRNGAGKSTLLKILSRITPPTKGHAILRGRLASLLEVGTGFHPELSGRENVYFNGSILGLRKAEIDRKFDEIVDFSGIERFIDTPLKNYSSGMQLRLAFAVAAHLEPEILIIDEVLAVGDAEFQKKCLGKMDEVSKSGRTVLFVSHNMALISQLCERSILLRKGSLVEDNATAKVLKTYIDSEEEKAQYSQEDNSDKEIFVSRIQMIDNQFNTVNSYLLSDDLILSVELKINKKVQNAKLSFILSDLTQRRIFNIEDQIESLTEGKTGTINLRFKIPKQFLLPNIYTWQFAIHVPNVRFIDKAENVCTFTIIDTGSTFTEYINSDNGCVFAPYTLI